MKSRFAVLLAFLLVSCGTKKSHNSSPAPQQGEKPGEQNSPNAKLDTTPVEMKAQSFFKLTRPFSQWQLNPISWEKAKGKQKGITSFDNVVAVPPAGQANYRHYNWGHIELAEHGCLQNDKTSVKLFLDAIENFKVKETQAMEFDKTVNVDPGKYAYNLRVEVLNNGNCDSLNLDLGVTISQ